MAHSGWPILVGMMAYCLVVAIMSWLHGWLSAICPVVALMLLVGAGSFWWRDIIRESSFQGQHTKKEQKALWVGFVLFICSEVMLFFSFFWAFFHSSLAPSVELGCYWPPVGIQPVNPWGAPASMTVVLVCSGVCANWAMHGLKSDNLVESNKGMVMAVVLGLLFLLLQVCEYYDCCFTISDSVFGSVFFLITGFHGSHVIAGTIFLIVQGYRNNNNHFSSSHHLGFEFSVWYWHFVDVIWLFVVGIIYVWGGWWGS
uniref:Cytochrome c oxidase subunit 3 n=1 Tax=Cucullaea labiata TaxID=142556 RepID=A0A141AX68_9BIVA|nr:cytochrome c oxidase subunit III [Cucullaea labiata]